MIKTNNNSKLKRLEQFTFVGGTSESMPDSVRQPKLNFPTTMFLGAVRENDWVLISKINTDRNTRAYLYRLGLKPKTSVRIVSHTASGSVIVSVGDRQIGLGADITQKVVVTLAGEKK